MVGPRGLAAGCVLAGLFFSAAAAAKPAFLDADSREDLQLALGERKAPASSREIAKAKNHPPDNDARLALLGMIRVYQVFLSSQDGDNCGFTLSCSRFGQAALKQYGVVEGTLMTSDRLQRCYGFGRDYYPVDPATDKAIDPVSADALWH